MNKELTPEEEIYCLNRMVKIKLAPSPIHGVGVFSIQPIYKGERLYADVFPQVYKLKYGDFHKKVGEQQLYPEVAELILSQAPQIVNGSHFQYPNLFFQAWVNHSDSPNYDAKNDIALCDIGAGVELTEDYRLIPGHEKVFPWLKLSTPEK